MTDIPQARRGPYAKGVAKREEILERTLEVIAREGYRGASVKELAEAVGLTQAGLLYYFGSKEELFAAILRKRDEMTMRAFPFTPDSARESLLETIRYNAGVPGLVELFSQMAAAATDVEHPAHEYFAQHGEGFQRVVAAHVTLRRERGEYGGDIDPLVLARVFQAAVDGMQLQWLLDPTVDMAAAVEALFALLEPSGE